MDKPAIENTVDSLKAVMESLRDLKLDARDKGFHIQALTLLVNVCVKNPKDQGAGALKKLFCHAQTTGLFSNLIIKQNKETQVDSINKSM
jgi:hypothetical protein